MKEIIEQKGKPCCINMITNEDRRFLQMLEKKAKTEERAKLRAEKLKNETAPDGTPSQGEEGADLK